MANMRITAATLRQIKRQSSPAWAALLDRAILFKPSLLEPAEIRYLRQRAGWVGTEAAQVLGVSSNVIVARWESGTRKMPKPTERLFRLLAASALGPAPLSALVERFRSSWREAPAGLVIHLYPERNRFEYRWATAPKGLPKPMHRLFWDVDAKKINLKRHADYVITRILDKGDLDDWHWLRWTYEEGRIAATLKKARALDPRTVHLWRKYLLKAEGEN